MNLSLSLDAKEVLFHLNYMGYRNISKEQLKYFMHDLKKLVKYESSPGGSTEIHVQAGPTSINIQRLFEHTISSRTKQKEPKDEQKQKNIPEHRVRPDINTEKVIIHQKPSRVKSAEAASRPKDNGEKIKLPPSDKKKIQAKPDKADKENIPIEKVKPPQPVKSKMWIRPRSSQVRKPLKKNDPVSLYQSYQKDWEKFKENICESSHSDLRWEIREKMMRNH